MATSAAASPIEVVGLYENNSILLAIDIEPASKIQSVRWRYEAAQGKEVDWFTLDTQHIIGFVPTKGSKLCHELLFVAGSDEAHATHKSITVKSIQIVEPPTDLVPAFSTNTRPFFRSHLHDSAPRLQVVVSVTSGTGRAEDFFKHALQPLLNLIADDDAYDVHRTTSAQSIIELTKDTFLPKANQGKEQAIVLLSGDGGMVDILFGLFAGSHESINRSPNIAIIPLGTGNALANSTGILSDKTMGLKTLLSGQPHELPKFLATFSANARYLVNEAQNEVSLQTIDGSPAVFGCVVCSWGLHAALVADSDTTEYRRFGAERFKIAAKENLFPSDGSMPHAYRGKLSVKLDGFWHDVDRTEHGYVLVTLVSHLESGFNISPASTPLDGVLRLVHFEPLSGKDAMDIMSKAYDGGKHVADARIDYSAVQAVRIVFNEDDARWRRVCIDGTIVKVEKGGWLEIRKDTRTAIRLIVP